MTTWFAADAARWQRLVARHRRLLAAVALGGAVWCALGVLAPPPVATAAVLAAARELPPGTTLRLGDLRTVALPAAAVPAGALRPGAPVLGRRVAGPVRRGEPLTDVRLLGPPLLAATGLGPGTVAVPVRLADAGTAALLRLGDRVDVLAVGAEESGEPARVVATDVLVVATPAGEEDASALVVVGCSPEVARALAAAGASRLSVAVRAP